MKSASLVVCFIFVSLLPTIVNARRRRIPDELSIEDFNDRVVIDRIETPSSSAHRRRPAPAKSQSRIVRPIADSEDPSTEEDYGFEVPSRRRQEKDNVADERGPISRRTCVHKYERSPPMSKTYPRPWEHAGFEASLPREWDWRNVSGLNYCSPNRNQHIPIYCGSCWVFGSTGALNDRFNIARKNRWPMTMVSPQEIIDCGGKGNCQGGTVGDVYEYAKTHGLVEEGCNNYRAENGVCDQFHRCGTCWANRCFAVKNYTRYYVKDFGPVVGLEKMKAEIHMRGPLACSIGATMNFEFNYTGGVYSEKLTVETNHIVSVSGWGVDEETNTEYWIVRNSWGDAWGETGWFRVVTSAFKSGQGNDYNMGIENDCYYADPDVSNLN